MVWFSNLGGWFGLLATWFLGVVNVGLGLGDCGAFGWGWGWLLVGCCWALVVSGGFWLVTWATWLVVILGVLAWLRGFGLDVGFGCGCCWGLLGIGGLWLLVVSNLWMNGSIRLFGWSLTLGLLGPVGVGFVNVGFCCL